LFLFLRLEHFLDIINADFSDNATVDKILDAWEEKHSDAYHKSGFYDDTDENVQIGVSMIKRAPLQREISILIRRHSLLIFRDPILYIGRCFLFMIMNSIFTLVLLQARQWNQDQATNKMWVSISWVGAPSNFGPVAVYALNHEFKELMRETKNGMVRPLAYCLAKTLLVFPILFIFAAFALAIPAFAEMDFPAEAFGMQLVLWVAFMFVFECCAECLSVWVNDPILGMMQVSLSCIIWF
jgi:hypothetical protein